MGGNLSSCHFLPHTRVLTHIPTNTASQPVTYCNGFFHLHLVKDYGLWRVSRKTEYYQERGETKQEQEWESCISWFACQCKCQIEYFIFMALFLLILLYRCMYWHWDTEEGVYVGLLSNWLNSRGKKMQAHPKDPTRASNLTIEIKCKCSPLSMQNNAFLRLCVRVWKKESVCLCNGMYCMPGFIVLARIQGHSETSDCI